MAEISRFYGIIIQMFGNDHNPPHFDVVFARKTILTKKPE